MAHSVKNLAELHRIKKSGDAFPLVNDQKSALTSLGLMRFFTRKPHEEFLHKCQQDDTTQPD